MKSSERNRCVLVTGGLRRIGAAISRHLVEEGYTVIAQSRGDDAAATDRAAALGVELVTFELADVTAIRRTIETHGPRLTDIVWCAAGFSAATLVDAEPEDWDEAFAVNARSAFFAAQAASRYCPGLRTITLFSDALAHTLGPSRLIHGLSKSVVEPATKALAAALAPKVRVNAVRPGPILPANGEEGNAAAHTMTGQWGDPYEVARVVQLFLEAPSITGAVVAVDGGRSALGISRTH